MVGRPGRLPLVLGLAVPLAVAGMVVLPRFALSLGAAQATMRTPVGQVSQSSSELVADLGCAACHPGLSVSADRVRSRAPSLEAAGSRFQPAYLYAFLREPNRIRRHIGASRMPSFGLDERESLALTLYLQSLVAMPPLPPNAPSELMSGRVPRGARETAEQLMMGDLGCLACHTLRGSGGVTGTELLDIGHRLQAEWVARYLATPSLLEPGTPMPSIFFDPGSPDAFRPSLSDAAAKVRIITEYLRSAADDSRREQERALERAKRQHPDVTADLGQSIYRALSCNACHESPAAIAGAVGPDLSNAGRLRPEWLRQYVRHPVSVRPFGFYPGSGSRMPDFSLSDAEADSVTGYLTRLAAPQRTAPFEPQTLTAFSRDKALRFIRDRYACLGCHRLDGEGGRIGPDLTGVASRLTPSAIHAMIQNPQRAMPRSIMPQRLMPGSQVDLIASYLAERTNPIADTYLSLTEHGVTVVEPDASDGRGLYLRFCAACHGVDGNGDGYNAQYLPVSPTPHADSSYMATRPDDTLFDGVHAGGHILGRSHRMPGFGQRLSAVQIRAIVAYMRDLCNCEGPTWSRDGRRE